MRDSYVLYMDKLKGEYKETFQKINIYVVSQNVDADTSETQMGELLDTFLLAQEEGRSVAKIVGNNLESFCKTFCSQFGWKNLIMNLLDRWKIFAWLFVVLGGMEIAFMIMDVISGLEVNFWSYESAFNLTGYIIAGVIVIGIETIVNSITIKLLFKKKNAKNAMQIIKVIQIATIVICFIVVFAFLQLDTFNFLKIPSWILLVVGGIYLIAYYYFNRERVKERKNNKISFFEIMKEEIEKDTDIEFQKEMQKMYEKKRARLLKKGREELSWEDFVEYQEKDVQKAYKVKPFYDWLPLIITFPIGVLEYLNNGLGAYLIIYVIILFFGELLILKVMWKIVKSALDVKQAWIVVEKKKLEMDIE